MELRHIRYFLAVAEAKSFTYAAETLGIGQPPLSMQIRDLENEIGTRLFHRVARGVELTAAGSAFYEDIRQIPGLVEQATLSALLASRGEKGILKMGFTSSSIFNAVVNRSIKQFKNQYTDVVLQLEEAHTAELIQMVKNGSIDLAFVRTDRLNYDFLEMHLLIREPLSIVLPEKHPLSQENKISLLQLENEEFIVCPRDYSIQLYDTIISLFNISGYTPLIKQMAPQLSSIISLVGAGLGISIIPSSMKVMNSSTGVVFCDIDNKGAYVPLTLISRVREQAPAVKNFISNAIATLEKYPFQY
ncbi:LysR family transcriptional regulator [Salmonella enterica]|nr:LysR family transcriptional regulator [Salmonella enterica]